MADSQVPWGLEALAGAGVEDETELVSRLQVEGTKPQSHGYVTPSTRGREMDIAPRSGEYFNLTTAPRGDSTTT
jgi:hypothetical protein